MKQIHLNFKNIFTVLIFVANIDYWLILGKMFHIFVTRGILSLCVLVTRCLCSNSACGPGRVEGVGSQGWEETYRSLQGNNLRLWNSFQVLFAVPFPLRVCSPASLSSLPLGCELV